mmetsp:Transcript_1655/g.3165  ORF Transcript_1655/g.3165 Transcript_1655/m.3165 type:complete len:253 (-) Transcript_1655:45-803(-)
MALQRRGENARQRKRDQVHTEWSNSPTTPGRRQCVVRESPAELRVGGGARDNVYFWLARPRLAGSFSAELVSIHPALHIQHTQRRGGDSLSKKRNGARSILNSNWLPLAYRPSTRGRTSRRSRSPTSLFFLFFFLVLALETRRFFCTGSLVRQCLQGVRPDNFFSSRCTCIRICTKHPFAGACTVIGDCGPVPLLLCEIFFRQFAYLKFVVFALCSKQNRWSGESVINLLAGLRVSNWQSITISWARMFLHR